MTAEADDWKTQYYQELAKVGGQKDLDPPALRENLKKINEDFRESFPTMEEQEKRLSSCTWALAVLVEILKDKDKRVYADLKVRKFLADLDNFLINGPLPDGVTAEGINNLKIIIGQLKANKVNPLSEVFPISFLKIRIESFIVDLRQSLKTQKEIHIEPSE